MKRDLEEISSENLEVFTKDVIGNRLPKTKKVKLVRDKSNSYDLVNKLAVLDIKEGNLSGFKNQTKLKNFNLVYVNKDNELMLDLLLEKFEESQLESLGEVDLSVNLLADSE